LSGTRIDWRMSQPTTAATIGCSQNSCVKLTCRPPAIRRLERPRPPPVTLTLE
jgi:hypothetical protein